MTIKPDKNYCKNQGLLIGSGVAISQNPSVYRSLDTWEKVPCSNIFCKNCNNQVRWIDGAILKGDPKDFYPLHEPEILPYLKRSSTFEHVRQYYCACRKYQTIGGVEMIYDERELSPAPSVWSCNGH